MSSEEEEEEAPPSSPIAEVDDDMLRVLVSTDNHLGYGERDPVRGLDSFAAFEEVLYLARKHKCDMVLIAGDLFHDNKPSRRTMHKTMEIIRRYCMGPEAVQIQIVSEQAKNFRSVHGTVNYEDEFYSVDLPIFSIHGNHDDPTRDGGTEMLAALDLLAVSNLVNYFGRQDEVDKVEVSPILIEKGDTRVALYGMGSMRDERLNRMWRGKKVRFLRPEEGDWFHVFALHQNRDLGRGVKNCVHESMIPEWMDLVVWGHEHECLIEPAESVVGTFRITQPGSSVATSLTGGEAVRKQVGLLEIKANQFRLQPIPLTQVRSFVIGELSLQEQHKELDPEDPKVDMKMTKILEEEVRMLVFEAREKRNALLRDAAAGGNSVRQDALRYTLDKPDEVLVRLKVEHTGFTTLNNQRFGARFVGDVANPADLLLFHRRKQGEGKGTTKKRLALAKPITPEELEEMNVEVLIKENLDMADKKLDILSEQRLGLAVEDFVAKEQNKAFAEAMQETLSKQQKKLIKRGQGAGVDEGGEGESGKVNSVTDVRDIVQHESQQRERKEVDATKTNGSKGRKQGAVELDDNDDDSLPEKENEGNDVAQARRKKSATGSTRGRKFSSQTEIDSSSADDVMVTAPQKTSSRSAARPSRKAARSRVNYNEGESGEDSESDAVIEGDDGSDDSLGEVEVQPKKRPRTTSSTRNKTAAKPQKTVAKASSRQRLTTAYDDDSDDDEVPPSAYGLDEDWGTATTNTAR